jgi:hypothetical protein
MMRAGLVGSAVSFIAAVAVAVPLAHAGGGPGKNLPGGTTVCRSILAGENAGQVIRFVTGSLDQTVQVGSAVLLCDLTPTTAHLERGPDLGTPCPGTGCTFTPTPGAVVCYAVAGASNQKDGATISDPFALDDAVQVGGIGLVCVPAHVE